LGQKWLSVLQYLYKSQLTLFMAPLRRKSWRPNKFWKILSSSLKGPNFVWKIITVFIIITSTILLNYTQNEYTISIQPYCEIIYICWTINFVFRGRTIPEFKILSKYLFMLIILQIIWNPRIKVSMNMPNVVKPQYFVPTKLNDFTVFSSNDIFLGDNVFIHTYWEVS